MTGTRADYGLMRETLTAIDRHPHLSLSLLVTGMHLAEEFGNTIKDVEKDGYRISHRINMLAPDDKPAGMARSIGSAIVDMSLAFEESQPDFVLLEGDRGESLAAAIAAAHMNIAVAHISGGDVTGTIIDESVRHAITKFAHIHFPGTNLSAERLQRMGEDQWRINMVGTPGANLKKALSMRADEVAKALGLDLSRPVFLVLQHPVTTEDSESPHQMRETMDAVCGLGEQTVVVYPNSDAGGRRMIKVIEGYEHLPFVHAFKSLPRQTYVGLLSVADVMIGNSSSAVVDAPNFGLPAVNVGTRQQGREHGGNLIDVGHDCDDIRRAIRYALDHQNDPAHQSRWNESPYEDIDAAEQIAQALGTVQLGPQLVQKRFDDSWLNERTRNKKALVDCQK